MGSEVSCGFVLINESSKKILILKSKEDFEWDLPKGHREEGEEFLQTAIREIEEEVNIKESEISIIKDNNDNLITDFYEYRSPETNNMRKIHLFIATTNVHNLQISNEHNGYAWCSIDEVLEYLKFDDVKTCVKKIYNKYIS